MRKTSGYWNPQHIDEAFDEIYKELGRVPHQKEFGEKYGGAIDAIRKGRYDSEISKWSEFLASKELKPRRESRWTPQVIDEAFDEIYKELGRVPTYREFGEKYGGAADAIIDGRYDSEISKWSEFLASKELKPRRESRWTPQVIDEAFDEIYKELGRTPTRDEFKNKYGGAVDVIKRGKYDPEIRKWNEFLARKGVKPYLEIRKWTPQAVGEAFDELRKELGRVPHQKEFVKKYCGAADAIRKGRYDSEISKWSEFVAHRITSGLSEIFILDDLLDLGLDNKRANKLVENALTLQRIYKLNSEHYTTSKELFDAYNSLQTGKKERKVAKKRGHPPLQKSIRIFPLETEGILTKVNHYEGSKENERIGVKTRKTAEINEVSKQVIRILNAANIVPNNAFGYEAELAKKFSSKEEYIRVYEEGLFPLTTNLMRVILEKEGGRNVLDIGNGVGAPTLQALKQLYVDFNYKGLDCISEIQEFNREKYGEMFLTLKVPYEFGEVEGKFDLVTASLVLDSLNLPEIYATLIGSHQFLEQDGKVITVISKAREEKVQQVLSILKGMGYGLELDPENHYFNLKLKDMGGKGVNNYFYIVRAIKEGELGELDLSKQYQLYLGLSYLKAGKIKMAQKILASLDSSLEEGVNELLKAEKHDYKEPPFRFLEEFKESKQREIERIKRLREEAKNSLHYLKISDICEGFAMRIGGNDFSDRKTLEEGLNYIRDPLSVYNRRFNKAFHETSEKAMDRINGKSRNKKRRKYVKDLSNYLQTLLNLLDADI